MLAACLVIPQWTAATIAAGVARYPAFLQESN